MKHTQRLVFGLISSLLLTVGFTRAASRLDPTVSGPSQPSATKMAVAQNCTGTTCNLEGDVQT